MKKYDYIVVGAGLAGLSASLELALNEKKVLLIEQHNIPGGCSSSFCRGRFEFDPSLHELCSLGSEKNPGSVRQLFDRYGVNIKWKKVDDCFRIVSRYSDGSPMDVTMPSGRREFIEKLEYYVPGSRESVEKLFALFKNVTDGLDYIGGDSISPKEIVTTYMPMVRSGGYNCGDVFRALKIPQKAIDILSTYWSYLGVDMEGLSFLHYASMVDSYVYHSAYIPEHTSHDISVSLVERFRELGGEVIMGCRAQRFLFRDDRCFGVKTTLGTFEASEAVFANINPDLIFGSMMPQEFVPKREKKLSAARNRELGARMFTAYFGLNKTPEELGIKDYSIFMPGTADSVKEYESLKHIDTNSYSIFLCYNIVNPSFSPEGTCVCSFTTMFTGAEDFNEISETDYFALKTKMAKKFIASLKKNAGIDITDAIEEMTVASPYTFARYLNAPEGSVYGFITKDWDGIISRTIEMNMGLDYKVKGLYPVGTSGVRGDGYSSALADGQIIASKVLSDKRKESM